MALVVLYAGITGTSVMTAVFTGGATITICAVHVMAMYPGVASLLYLILIVMDMIARSDAIQIRV